MKVTESGAHPSCGLPEHRPDVRVCSQPTKQRRTTRWLLLALIFASIFSMGRLVGAFQKEQEILRAKAIVAERFEIRGEDKKIRASLSNTPAGGATLAFFDGNGKAQLILGISASGWPVVSFFGDDKSPRMSFGLDPGDSVAGIQLFDAKGEPTLGVGIDKTGPSMLIGKKGKGQILMSVADQQSSSIVMLDSKNRPRISLNTSENEPKILLLGDNNAIRASWRVHSDGAVSFSLRDRQSKERLVIMTDKDGKPSIKFLNSEGRVAKAL